MPTASPNETVRRLNSSARAFGCPSLLFFDGEPTPAHLDYLDLLPAKHPKGTVLPDATAEFQGRALLYFVDGAGPTATPQHIERLQQLLANRGEHACLGIVRPGSLDVYPINLDRQALKTANFRTIEASSSSAPMFFQALATGTYELNGRPEKADYVFETIHDLLTAASRALAGTSGKQGCLQGLDVLSTTGRALFFRFLVDRRIVLESEVQEICPAASDLRDTFSTASKAAATSCWLDETFNGDLLPLLPALPGDASTVRRLRAYRDYYNAAEEQTGGQLFRHLEAILRGWKHLGQGTFQPPLFDVDWDDLNFAHIPIGVLSQVYETFSHQWDEGQAQETGVHYTPRTLARILVDEAFAGVDNKAEAVVLDPACGAGVFLVLAFRRLVHEHWKKYGNRPDTRAVQRILYKQLRGFEISESALRLSALALYITAIELNGTQRPPRSLKFPRPLRGEVLFDFGHDNSDGKRGFVLGSLGSQVPVALNGIFDIVVTNPPWTRLRAVRDYVGSQKIVTEINTEFTAISRRALKGRKCDDLANDYENPDHNPDLPFLWRATEWARPNGLIAMALPARIILKQAGKGKEARDTLLQALAVTGILNGSDLEKTPVWPNMDLPFMLVFARNAVPRYNHTFHFVTPVRENRLSTIGQFRIDYKSAEVVGVQDVINKPWLLKALGIGTALDVDVIERLPKSSVREFWQTEHLYSGEGYHIGPGLKQYPADHLLHLQDLRVPKSGFAVPDDLKTWGKRHTRRTAHMPRNPKLYEPPLAIVHQAVGENRDAPKAFLSLTRSLAFSKSFYGFSAAGAEQGDTISALIYLIVHSLLFQHFCLMRSSRQGASYRTILKEDIENFPFPDPRTLTSEVRTRIVNLAHSLQRNERSWDEIDKLIFEICNLDEHDKVVVRDTVTYCGPYRSVRERAESPITPKNSRSFCQYLEAMLQPLFRLTDQRVAVHPIDQDPAWGIPAWQFVTVTMANQPSTNWSGFLTKLTTEANKTGASRVVVRVPQDGGLLVGIINQQRFWTRSRAWLCSLHVEQNHLNAFPVEAR
jgi:hypothetical protein